MYYTSREVYEYISKKIGDPIVEWKNCVVSGQPFPIYQSDLDFYAKISPTFDGKKFLIPTPTLCPEERQRRRLSFRNERKLYKRKCDATGENIISIYSPDKPYKVYDQKFRRSDNRDPIEYGREFDFSKTFTEQFGAFSLQIPKMNVINDFHGSINSEYTNYSGVLKNCYLVFENGNCEDCLYCHNILQAKDVVDSDLIYTVSEVYEGLDCSDCTNCFYIQQCRNSHNLMHCYGCSQSDHLIFCTGLQQKSFCILNQEVDKNEWKLYKQRLLSHPSFFSQELKKYKALLCCGVFSNNNSFYNFGCIANTLTYSSKNTKLCHNVSDAQNLSYCSSFFGAQDCYDCHSRGFDDPYGTAQRCLECVGIGNSADNLLYCNLVWHNVASVSYSQYCRWSKHLFGCEGLRNKQYCIFNKQYTKDDYEKMVAKIIAHMQETGERGEFFHPSLSPFGYNETVAQEYYPCSVIARNQSEVNGDVAIHSQDGSPQLRDAQLRDDGVHINFGKFGYHRSTYNADPVIPAGAKVVDWKTISEEPTEDEQILKTIFVCEVSGRPFRIIKQELDFYRKHTLPLPHKHPDVRHAERMKLRPGRTLYLGNCDKCGKEMLSVYPSRHPEGSKAQGRIQDYTSMDSSLRSEGQKVYCETCYQKEIYS